MAKIKNSSGFTLIELITVSGIMALFSITLISVFMASFRGGSKAQLLQVVRQNGDFAMTAMVKEIRAAEEIIICSGSNLRVKTILGSLINYHLSGDRVASDSTYLTSTAVNSTAAKVTNLNFSCLAGKPGNQIVTISFKLVVGSSTSQAQEKLEQTFATSVSTRQY